MVKGDMWNSEVLTGIISNNTEAQSYYWTRNYEIESQSKRQ